MLNVRTTDNLNTYFNPSCFENQRLTKLQRLRKRTMVSRSYRELPAWRAWCTAIPAVRFNILLDGYERDEHCYSAHNSAKDG